MNNHHKTLSLNTLEEEDVVSLSQSLKPSHDPANYSPKLTLKSEYEYSPTPNRPDGKPSYVRPSTTKEYATVVTYIYIYIYILYK